MAGTSAIVTLLFGGLAPRLLKDDLASVADRPAADRSPAALPAAVAEALVWLREGVNAAYADAPDIDFAATLARHDAALGALCRAVERADTDRRLRRLAGRLAAATAARRELLEIWQSEGGLETAWVLSGSSVPLRFLEAQLSRDLATLPGGDGPSDFVRIAVAVRRRALDLARLQIELGRDRRLKALATSLAAAASADVGDLESWWLEHAQARAAMTHPLH
jgi:uncharacterized protein (DUF305 family)